MERRKVAPGERCRRPEYRRKVYAKDRALLQQPASQSGGHNICGTRCRTPKQATALEQDETADERVCDEDPAPPHHRHDRAPENDADAGTRRRNERIDTQRTGAM